MAEINKVVWTEGMFLLTEHFQQQDRNNDYQRKTAINMLHSYPWGFSSLAIDQQHLSLGRIAVTTCAGIFPDGTLFNINNDCDAPAFFEVPADIRNSTIYVGIPFSGVTSKELAQDRADDSMARYSVKPTSVMDITGQQASATEINVARLRLRILTDADDLSQFAVLPIAKVIERRADGSIVLEPKFIPPSLDIKVSPFLKGFLQEILGLLHNRAEDLAQRVTKPGASGLSSMLDFLMLQLVNRYEAYFMHISEDNIKLHPQHFFGELLKLYGELVTVTSTEKRPKDIPKYNHQSPSQSFLPLLEHLRHGLSVVLEQTAVPMPIQLAKQGIRVALLNDKMLLGTSSFIVAVKANLAEESLRNTFPAQVKIGPVEKIRGLINIQLPGISLEVLSVAPPEIPYHAGFTYFSLNKTGQFWEHMKNSAGFAFHVSGDFPGLEMEFWAIKQN